MSTSAIGEILGRIAFDGDDVDIVAMYEAEKELLRLPDPRAAIPEIFLWFETHRDKWLGSPGPLVHFIEGKFDFFPYLLESLQRLPTDHTVMMANSIANAANDEDAVTEWIRVLEAATRHPLADESCKAAATEMLEYQRGRLRDA